MDTVKNNLSKLDVLLCGLAFTSRTETLEDYLKDKTKSLTVISISSCFLKENLSFCRIYEKGVLKNSFSIPNFRIKNYRPFRQPLILIVFIFNWLVILFTIIKVNKKFDLFIGVSHSFAFIGALLKKIKLVKQFIYYCIDYYIPEEKLNFNSMFVRLINILDRFTVKNADFIWDISEKISKYRQKLGGIKKGSYRNIIVPLGYSRHIRQFKTIDEINRWQVGFVGTITANQGLQLLVDAMPQLLKRIPQIKIQIIGDGPFSQELRNMVIQKKLENHFKFAGFIKNEEEMLDLLSRSAIGLALYNDSTDNRNIICADSGKPKLYALLGLPAIVTNFCSISDEIKKQKAGISINYNSDELVDAISFLLEDQQRLIELKVNSFKLGESFVSDSIFDEAFRVMEVG